MVNEFINIIKNINILNKERIQLSGMYLSSHLVIKNIRRQMKVPGARSTKKINL